MAEDGVGSPLRVRVNHKPMGRAEKMVEDPKAHQARPPPHGSRGTNSLLKALLKRERPEGPDRPLHRGVRSSPEPFRNLAAKAFLRAKAVGPPALFSPPCLF
jgi:hypothetical protein